MKPKMRISENGQSLVFVLALMIVLLAMLALVLDGGYSYFQRRNAQNAADAGALAGARAKCRKEDPAAAASSLVSQNHAVMESITYPSEGEVEVTARIQFNTFFASILGNPTATARAVAAAGCYPPGEGIGVMPIAWSCRPPVGQPAGEECAMEFMEGEQCTLADPMYIIADSDTIEVETECKDPATGLPSTGVDCDLDDDGENDITLLSGGNRSWLDLNGGGGGGAELKDWLTGGFTDEIYPHYWVAAQSGVNNSVYDTVHDKLINKDVVLPVFDMICPNGVPTTNCPAQMHANDTVVGNEPHDYFHLISFAYWRTTCVEAGSHKGCPGRDKLDAILAAAGWTNGNINSLSTMEGCFREGFVAGVKGGGGGIPYAGLWTIYLIK